MITYMKKNNVYYFKNNSHETIEIKIDDNRYHSKHCYLKFDNSHVMVNWQAIFDLIYRIENKPLQVMLSSHHIEKCRLLEKSGFLKLRSCYEMAVTKNHLKTTVASRPVQLDYIDVNNDNYLVCCQQLYAYYQQTHEQVNPLTATFEQFIVDLPQQICIEKFNHRIQHIAFIEANEIAYVCTNQIETVNDFLYQLCVQLLYQHEVILFEADDTDVVAMLLKQQFNIEVNETYDTFVYKK